MTINSDDITRLLRQRIDSLDTTVQDVNVGTVVEVGDGIARIVGLSEALAGELLEFPEGVLGMALNLEEDTVGSVLLGAYEDIKAVSYTHLRAHET